MYPAESLQRNARGFTLIEILVALLVFTLGLLGIAALQLYSVKSTLDTAQRSHAVWVTQDIAERIQATPADSNDAYLAAIASNDCDTRPTSFCSDHYRNGINISGDTCTAEELATFEIWDALCLNRNILQESTRLDCSDSNQEDAFSCSRDSTLTLQLTFADKIRPDFNQSISLLIRPE